MSHRIDQVFELASGNLRRLSRPGTVLALMGLPVMCIAAVVGLTAPASRVLHQAPQPVVLAQLQQPAPPPQPAPQPAPKPRFDSASIKPCSPNDVPANGGRGGRGGAGARYFNRSPGRISVTCMSVSDLIGIYVNVWGENDRPINSGGPSDTQPIRGGPSWVYSDRYTIEASTADPVANGSTDGFTPAGRMLQGPMLQALLEDRFQLKTHRETEDVPMYALTVAKGGFKLKPMEEGGCAKPDPTEPNRLYFPGPDEKPLCGSVLGGSKGPGDPNFTLVAGGSTLTSVAQWLSGTLDRHIIDKTGITGIFNIRLEFARDENAPGSLPPGAIPAQPSETPVTPSVFTVLEQQLGLKLVADKGPRGYIVIDSVERPSEN